MLREREKGWRGQGEEKREWSRMVREVSPRSYIFSRRSLSIRRPTQATNTLWRTLLKEKKELLDNTSAGSRSLLRKGTQRARDQKIRQLELRLTRTPCTLRRSFSTFTCIYSLSPPLTITAFFAFPRRAKNVSSNEFLPLNDIHFSKRRFMIELFQILSRSIFPFISIYLRQRFCSTSFAVNSRSTQSIAFLKQTAHLSFTLRANANPALYSCVVIVTMDRANVRKFASRASIQFRFSLYELSRTLIRLWLCKNGNVLTIVPTNFISLLSRFITVTNKLLSFIFFFSFVPYVLSP